MSVVIRTPYGLEISRQSMNDVVSAAAGDHLGRHTTVKGVRNALSSWNDGHLRGREHQHPTACVRDACGYRVRDSGRIHDGMRGRVLFGLETPCCAILDAGAEELREPTAAAKRLGLLDLKQSEPMSDMCLATLLADTGRKSIDGPHR